MPEPAEPTFEEILANIRGIRIRMEEGKAAYDRERAEAKAQQSQERLRQPPPPPKPPAAGRPMQWFEVLGVAASDSAATIKAAYRQKIRAYHPDSVASLGPEYIEVATQKAQEINEAYQTAKRLKNIS